MLQAAAERWLTIIGEAAGRISEAFQHAHPEIPWREIIGMRNLLIHGYHHVEIDAVWEAITTGVPERRTAITDTLNNNPR